MKNSVHIFLGANSGEGFFSLYGQLSGRRFDDLLILKGGPGCGKSSFMRTVADAMAEANEEIIYVNCSGDPDSLDGVLFPRLKSGVVDGTAPHVLEPVYPAAHERYVDLMRFYDVAAAKGARVALDAHADAYRAAYADAYRCLRAADALASEGRAAARAAGGEAAARRVAAAFRRELRGRRGGGGGRVDRAFLGGLTHRGELCRFDTAQALCPRVYELADGRGLAAGALERLGAEAAGAGFDILVCPDPDRPRETAHVLVPELGCAFVTSSARRPFPGKPYRRLRLDALAAAGLDRAEKARLRFAQRVERALRKEAEEALRRAKRAHDLLEAAYNPFVHFDGVYALAAEEAERLRAGV